MKRLEQCNFNLAIITLKNQYFLQTQDEISFKLTKRDKIQNFLSMVKLFENLFEPQMYYKTSNIHV